MGGIDPTAVAGALFDFALRPSQSQAVHAVVAGRDTLAVLPTGSGKSAIYQVAGLSIGGLTLVISPPFALQRDQIRSIAGRRCGGRAVEAALLNSAQKAHERQDTFARLARGDLDFLFMGPEQLTNAEARGAVRGGGRDVGCSSSTRRIWSASGARSSGRNTCGWATRSPSWAARRSSP
ncbi:DEAD/DEAH box helicase [Amycolatopsis acidiphila]|nr:DEAD/DEAH box helicase [Amycolatopsis acidiphila]UIJ57362.1 DEAD/DEAH box helicase [Amycolatopsis acidiphila]GHG84606.1 hypothetical protein GCM10017788_56830 [Amycolatopsis acidiphila]